MYCKKYHTKNMFWQELLISLKLFKGFAFETNKACGSTPVSVNNVNTGNETGIFN